MDTISAYAMGMANRGKKMKVFDWVRAAKLIAERKPQVASAGLSEDWGWTGGEIFRDGLPVPEEDTYVYLHSTWATPVLLLDGEEIECWVMEDDEAAQDGAYWPEPARQALSTPST